MTSWLLSLYSTQNRSNTLKKMTEKHLCVWPAVQHGSQWLHNSAQCSFVLTFNVICVVLLVMPVACDAVDLSPFLCPPPHQWWEQCTAQVNFCDLGKHRIKKQEQERKKKESSQSSQKASEEVFLKGKFNNLEIFLFHILFTEVIFYNFVLLFFSLSIFLLVILACVEFVFSVLASPVG